MSLNVTIASNRFVIQVDDLRLSQPVTCNRFKLYTDYAVKTTVVACLDAFIVCSYHGIGEYNNLRTDHWLIDTLIDIGADTLGLQDLCRKLRPRVECWYSNLRKKIDTDAAHSFIMSGYMNGSIPIVVLLSNYERFAKQELRAVSASEDFHTSAAVVRKGDPSSYALHIGGRSDKVRESDVELLRKLVQLQGANEKDILAVAVRTVRNAAKKTSLISSHCMSVLMHPNNRVAEAGYWKASKMTEFMPNFVGSVVIKNPVFYTGEGVPPFQIRFFLPKGCSADRMLAELSQAPATFTTGDSIDFEISDTARCYLQKLPQGATISRIRESLLEK
jgi:hypothetical protein